MTDLSKYEQPFDPDWPHGHLCESEGAVLHTARIIAKDIVRPGGYLIAAAVLIEGNNEEIWTFRTNGSNPARQIINAPAPKRTWWVNVYIARDNAPIATFHSTKEDADAADPRRIACIKVTEGEGLEDD